MTRTKIALAGLTILAMACGAENYQENPAAIATDADLMVNARSGQEAEFEFTRQGFVVSAGTIDNTLGGFEVKGEAQAIDSSRARDAVNATLMRSEGSMAMAIVAITGIEDEVFNSEGLTTTFIRDEAPPARNEPFFGLTACAGPSSGFNIDSLVQRVEVTVDEVNDDFRILSVESDDMDLTLRIDAIDEEVEDEARPRTGD